MASEIGWNIVDRLVSLVSPRAGRERLADRVMIDTIRRSYDGAARSTATQGWRTANKSADAEIAGAGGILRDRMRDLVRNDPLAAQAVQVLVNNIVGPGIRPRAKSPNKAINKKVDKLWASFAASCDFHGHTDFHGLLLLAVREMIEGGEVLAIQRFQPRGDGTVVPLKIELREGDHLDSGRMSDGPDAARISQGIEYDASGRRIAYWMFPDHPGGSTHAFGRRFTSERVPASIVAHMFERQRVQSRGVPWGVAAMRGLRDFGDWHRAELVRKKAEACMVAMVVGEDSDTQGITPLVVDADGNRIEEFSPGMIGYVKGGTDVKFNQPAPVGGTAEWSKTQMHIIAAGFRVPYALMSGDLSGANFSSSRVGLNEFRRMIDQMQWTTVIPMFCQPIWDWFVQAIKAQGLIPDTTPDIAVEWAPPKFESVNPLDDAQTDLLEVRAGFATLPQKIAARGYDPEAVIEEWQESAKALDQAGLILDSDPRRVTKVGSSQPDNSSKKSDGGKPAGSE